MDSTSTSKSVSLSLSLPSSSAAPPSRLLSSSSSSTNLNVGPIRGLFFMLVLTCIILSWVQLFGYSRSNNQYNYNFHLINDDNNNNNNEMTVNCNDLQYPTIQSKSIADHNDNDNNNYDSNYDSNNNMTLPFASPYTLNPNILPQSTESPLVVMVLSRRNAFEVRNVIRQTWANRNATSSSPTANHHAVYFVVGQGCKVPISLRDTDGGGNPKCKVVDRPLPNNYRTLTREQISNVQQEDEQLLKEQQIYRDLIFAPTIDIYRNLPKKLKAAYTFVHHHLPREKVQWVLKVDDDFYVHVEKFQNHLLQNFGTATATGTGTADGNNDDNNNNNDISDRRLLVGHIRRTNTAHLQGKWKEVPQFPRGGLYPPFPLGSRGHAVTRSVVEYIVKHQDVLFDYQGEDVSIGIWLYQQQFMKDEDFVDLSDVMVNDGKCTHPTQYVIGHDLTPTKMKQCFDYWKNKQEQEQQQQY